MTDSISSTPHVPRCCTSRQCTSTSPEAESAQTSNASLTKFVNKILRSRPRAIEFLQLEEMLHFLHDNSKQGVSFSLVRLTAGRGPKGSWPANQIWNQFHTLLRESMDDAMIPSYLESSSFRSEVLKADKQLLSYNPSQELYIDSETQEQDPYAVIPFLLHQTSKKTSRKGVHAIIQDFKRSASSPSLRKSSITDKYEREVLPQLDLPRNRSSFAAIKASPRFQKSTDEAIEQLTGDRTPEVKRAKSSSR